MLFRLPNPIPKTVVDRDELIKSFQKYSIVPYYGTKDATSHSMLDLLSTLTDLSPTFKAVRRDLATYTFGLNLNIEGRTIPGLATDPVEVDFPTQARYADYYAGLNISLKKIIKLSRRIDHHRDVCGNAYLRIWRIEVAGAVRYEMDVPHYKHVGYLRSIDPGEEFIIISKFLDDIVEMERNPPTILRATQEGEQIRWTQTEPGVEQAIIHIKAESDNDESDFYARPAILGALTWLYTDFQLGNLNSKVSATELITKKLLAFEAPDPNLETDDDDDSKRVEVTANGYINGRKMDRFERNMLILKELTTNIGRHPSALGPDRATSTIGGVEYPHGAKEPTQIDLEVVHHQRADDDQPTPARIRRHLEQRTCTNRRPGRRTHRNTQPGNTVPGRHRRDHR